jgi:hypothetical protein
MTRSDIEKVSNVFEGISAALRSESVIAQRLHQLNPYLGNAECVNTRDLRPVGKAETRE